MRAQPRIAIFLVSLHSEFLFIFQKRKTINFLISMKKLFLLMALATCCISAVNAQTTLYVKPDASSNAWNGMSEMVYTNLQDAIDAAQAGDQIWVAAGTYVPTSNFPNGTDNRCKSFVLKSGVAIYGSFAGTETDLSQRETEDLPFYFTNPTVLSGDPVHILEFSYVVGAHPPVLACCGIACHPALVITTEQTFHIELEEVSLFLFMIKQST